MVVAVLYLCGCGCDLYLCGCGCGGQAPSSSFYTGDVGVGDSSLRVHHPVGGAPANTEVCIFFTVYHYGSNANSGIIYSVSGAGHSSNF